MTLPCITFDCSSLQSGSLAPEQRQHVEGFIEWVRSMPRRGAVHILLRSNMNDRQGRTLKNRLQALGCRVTLRLPELAMA